MLNIAQATVFQVKDLKTCFFKTIQDAQKLDRSKNNSSLLELHHLLILNYAHEKKTFIKAWKQKMMKKTYCKEAIFKLQLKELASIKSLISISSH